MKSAKVSLIFAVIWAITACSNTTNDSKAYDFNVEGTTDLVNQETQSAAYYLIPAVDSEVVGLFVEERPQYRQIVGYSALGHVFLYSPEDKEYVVFYPYLQAGKSYGSFDSLKEFEDTILKEEGFSSYVLKDWFLPELVAEHGALDKEEVFIPAPYFNSDSVDVADYSKGNIWVMLTLTNQFFNEES